MEFNTDKPTRSAMYLVDRGMQGKHYRWYNARLTPGRSVVQI